MTVRGEGIEDSNLGKFSGLLFAHSQTLFLGTSKLLTDRHWSDSFVGGPPTAARLGELFGGSLVSPASNYD